MYGLGLKSRNIRAAVRAADFSPEVLQYLNRLFYYPSDSKVKVFASYIDSLVAAGVWAKLDVLYILAADDEGNALTNLVSSDYQGTRRVDADAITFTPNSGYSSTTVLSVITTRFNPSTAVGAKFSLNDASFGFWRGSNTQINQIDMTAGDSGETSTTLEIYSKWSNSMSYAAVNGPEFGASNPNDPGGLFIAQRTASNASALYLNDNLIASSSANSTSMPNKVIYPTLRPLTRMLFIGKSFTPTERAAFYSSTQTLLTSIVGSTP